MRKDGEFLPWLFKLKVQEVEMNKLTLTIFWLVKYVVGDFDIVHFDPNEVLLRNCRLHPAATSPRLFNNGTKSQPIIVLLSIDRWLTLDDVTESFDITGSVIYLFSNDCVKKLVKDPKMFPAGLAEEMPILKLDPYRFWKPALLIRNAMENQFMDRPTTQVMYYNIVEELFYVNFVGTFSMYCDLDFYYFPMDTQECSISVASHDATQVVTIINARYHIFTDNFMASNSMWEPIRYWSNITTNVWTPLLNFHEAKFTVLLERKPNWHLLNLFGPSFIFCILELASFLIPSELPDRAAFSVTILLAFTVLQSQIVKSMPATPKPIIIQYYVFFEMLYSMTIAIYSAGICLFRNHFSRFANQIAVKGTIKTQWKLWHLIEIIAFIIACGCLVLMNCFTLITIINKL